MTHIHSFTNVEVSRESKAGHGANNQHQWVTVVNPTNRRMLLQACDNCGVVKSENTVIRNCKEPQGRGLVSASLFKDLRATA